MKKIPVFVINLEKRVDRKLSIISQFGDKEEFELHIVHAFENGIGTIGLWQTIVSIMDRSISAGLEYIIICEDDHGFTGHYNSNDLLKLVENGRQYDLDIMLGGVSWLDYAVQVSDRLFWVNKFSGLQFTVVYKKFFQSILNADFSPGAAADYKISDVTDNKMIIYPFISTQIEFGYSDVTAKNNKKGYIKRLFKRASETLFKLEKVTKYYDVQLWNKL